MGCFLLLSILQNIGQHVTQWSRGILEIISRNSFTSSCTGHFIQVPLCIINKIFTVTLPLILNSHITVYTRGLIQLLASDSQLVMLSLLKSNLSFVVNFLPLFFATFAEGNKYSICEFWCAPLQINCWSAFCYSFSPQWRVWVDVNQFVAFSSQLHHLNNCDTAELPKCKCSICRAASGSILSTIGRSSTILLKWSIFLNLWSMLHQNGRYFIKIV